MAATRSASHFAIAHVTVNEARQRGICFLAARYCEEEHPVAVCRSAAGFYLGCWGGDGPISRESQEYWASQEKAEAALASGSWTQRLEP